MRDLKEIFEGLNKEYTVYGIRVDEVEYEVGDTCYNSHELFQDPMYDENDELIYPEIEEGICKGFYDAGELNGTCSVKFDIDNFESFVKAVETAKDYDGSNISIIAGEYFENGNDLGEAIIEDAKVIARI